MVGRVSKAIWRALAWGCFVFVVAIQAAHALSLKSPAFSEGSIIPNTFTFNSAGQCSGSNASPPLVFDGVPDGTKSFALIVRDPDGGNNWLHWKVWNVPATVDAFPAGYSSWMPTSFAQAVNTFGERKYGGPCPPSGSHQYVFTLYALGVSSLGGEPSDAQLAAAALQTATLTGYRSPTSNLTWTSNKTVQKGWWLNPRESGRGYSIEQSAATNMVFLAAYSYELAGAATWYVSGMSRNSAGVAPFHEGALNAFANGQSLQGAYRAPTSSRYGSVYLDTVDTDRALLTIIGDGANQGMALALRRFEYFPGSLSATVPATVPESGWWWNAQESGKGYFLEFQQNSAYLAAYTYNTNGTPVWYVTYNSMASSTSFQGALQQYANGQVIGWSYQAPVWPTQA
jgi:Raf kinase inhibitor-like YbhB/YbcL family protein